MYRAAACEREAPGLMAAGEEPSCAVARRRTFVVSEEGTANVTQVVAVVAFPNSISNWENTTMRTFVGR